MSLLLQSKEPCRSVLQPVSYTHLDVYKRQAVDYTNRKETKNSLKRTLYRLLSEYTGVELPWGNLTGIRPTKIPMALLEEGKSEEEIARYMKETYFTSDEKIKLSIEIAERELELLHKLDYEEGYSLYRCV